MFDTGVSILSDTLDDRLKYSYFKRKTYDYHHEKSQKKFDGILHRLARVENMIHVLMEQDEVLGAEIESLRLDKTSVRIAGKRETLSGRT